MSCRNTSWVSAFGTKLQHVGWIDMDYLARCPECGSEELDLRKYYSMMVLSNSQALFSLRCEHCNTIVSVVENIPAILYPDVQQAAKEVHAGMGQSMN